MVEPERHYSDAELFCAQEYDWIVATARRASVKWGLSDYASDIGQEVCKKARDIPNEKWAGIENKKAYIARAIIRKAYDLCHRDQNLEPLTEAILESAPHRRRSNPLEALEAADEIEHIYRRLSDAERRLFDLLWKECSAFEIAKCLGISDATARKRVSRLRMKLSLLCQKPQISVLREPIGVGDISAPISLSY